MWRCSGSYSTIGGFANSSAVAGCVAGALAPHPANMTTQAASNSNMPTQTRPARRARDPHKVWVRLHRHGHALRSTVIDDPDRVGLVSERRRPKDKHRMTGR